jgi:hypothetical protein
MACTERHRPIVSLHFEYIDFLMPVSASENSFPGEYASFVGRHVRVSYGSELLDYELRLYDSYFRSGFARLR